ncbi:hypothetical protein AB6806_27360 [Bosea sp. RCC_152_1]|uniref:hypothetical protein n=1 Tax=Bosea sp. RCC_152_1 TaxID=3239228 RepID=UPI0035268C83
MSAPLHPTPWRVEHRRRSDGCLNYAWIIDADGATVCQMAIYPPFTNSQMPFEEPDHEVALRLVALVNERGGWR